MQKEEGTKMLIKLHGLVHEEEAMLLEAEKLRAIS
jgi:hypothetical protein